MPATHDDIFAKAVELGASDIHIAANAPIIFRIDGDLTPQMQEDLTVEQTTQLVTAILGEENFKRLGEKKELDLAHALPDGARFRVNCHYERGTPGLVARLIPTDVPTLDDIGMNFDVVRNLCSLQNGLILMTGPTGSGKSTSLAAMIQHILDERSVHVISVEDPIEFLFTTEQGLVRQRQYGTDFVSFPEALKHVLRQDPDIVMVGEMRDLETIAAALTLAETGHLTFATLHTPNAVQTVDRIVDVFPPHQQHQIRTQLSMALKAIIAQRLIPREGGGRIAVREILVNTPAIGNIIRENRAQELASVVQTGTDVGMTTFARDAKRLLKEGEISKETFKWAEQG